MENKAILFVSHLIPKEVYSEVRRYSKNNMQDAANALQWHLVEGFNHNLQKGYDIVNYMPVGSFPQYYKKAYVKSKLFDAGADNAALNIGFCNIKYLRRSSISKGLYRSIEKWCKKKEHIEKIIIIYTLNPILLNVLSKLKDKFENIEVCAIVADLPNMANLSSKKNIISRTAQKIFADDAYSNIGLVDKFVFLTKQMSDYVGNEKPFCVMEGISTVFPQDIKDLSYDFDDDIKTILYTGTLHKKFGVLHLVEAFLKITDPNYRLIICGAGDSEQEIRAAADKDKRIIFLGQLSREEVLKLQYTSTVLVNPRMNNEEFTKYSFPSKNLEYMSSGTPLIAYKLDGIPDEYDEYINYVTDNEIDSLKEKIQSICNMEPEYRRNIGEKAKRFVLDKKNSVAQTKRIIRLIYD